MHINQQNLNSNSYDISFLLSNGNPTVNLRQRQGPIIYRSDELLNEGYSGHIPSFVNQPRPSGIGNKELKIERGDYGKKKRNKYELSPKEKKKLIQKIKSGKGQGKEKKPKRKNKIYPRKVNVKDNKEGCSYVPFYQSKAQLPLSRKEIVEIKRAEAERVQKKEPVLDLKRKSKIKSKSSLRAKSSTSKSKRVKSSKSKSKKVKSRSKVQEKDTDDDTEEEKEESEKSKSKVFKKDSGKEEKSKNDIQKQYSNSSKIGNDKKQARPSREISKKQLSDNNINKKKNSAASESKISKSETEIEKKRKSQ